MRLICLSEVFLGLGSNLGDRLANLQRATMRLAQLPGTTVDAVSGVYETPPMYLTDQPPFLNACLRLQTQLGPFRLLQEIARIEGELGRTREVRYGPRTLDLDIVLFGSLILKSARLTIPHPGLTERPFVLLPLADLHPEKHIPGIGRLSELVAATNQESAGVLKILDALLPLPIH